MPKRSWKRKRRHAPGRVKLVSRLVKRLWKRRWFRRGLFVLLLFVLGINLAVRFFGGGNAFPLSPFHLVDKSRALIALARHQAVGDNQPTKNEIRHLLRQTAGQHKVPAALALATAEVESDFMPVRISPAGAMGLMQLMPGTAAGLGVRDPFDARESIHGGVRYLANLWTLYRGDVRRVAAAYNAGPGRVSTSGPLRMSSETSRYVAMVLQRFAAYQPQESSR
jgi:soluble lytic murein transglycosylase-like protein